MKQSEFIQRIKLQAPNLGQTGITDPYLATLLNSGVDEVNLLCKVYKGYTDFTISADKRVYSLAESAPLYLGADKRGLFFKNTDGDWKKLIPKTEAWLSQKYQDYLNASSVALPTYYYLDGDDLGLYPPPSTTTALGARIYHLKKANPMASGDHYPFSGSATEIVALKPLDSAIISFVLWKINPAFGTNTDTDLRERDFISECRKSSAQIKRRPDLSISSDNKART